MEALFALIGRKVERPFRRLPYVEAMEKYGSDKPDLRVPLEMRDLTAVGRDGSSEVLKNAVAAGGEVKGLLIPGAGGLSRGQLDKLGEKAKSLGAKGLIWIKKQDGWKSSLKTAEADYEADLGRPWRRRRRPGPSRRRQEGNRPQSPGRDPPDLAHRGRRPPRPPRLLLGHRLPALRVERGREALRLDAPPLHLAPRGGPPSPRDAARTRSGPRPMTSSSTAPRSAAARSVSTTWTSSAASSRRLA